MTSQLMTPQLTFNLSPEVADALNHGKPVVALESTIISHGLPYPENLDTALALEETIRAKGVTPATIAVIDGVATVGLTKNHLNVLSNPETEVMKLSRRDLPFAFSKKCHGATTVAATMLIAAAAGLKVFATGGIGGVHRGANQSFDISADLLELAQTNVAVVCAGPKAILDIPATMEYLETMSVPVIGYQCDTMPAFWSRTSDIAMPCRLDTPQEIAALCQQKWGQGLHGGVLITNPVPAANEIPSHQIETAIRSALDQAKAQNIIGKSLTPFLLDSIRHITEGASLKTNKALVLNNAALAADLAADLAANLAG